MAKIIYRTRGNSNPKGKPRVYFTCYPSDFELYFDKICEALDAYADQKIPDGIRIYCPKGETSKIVGQKRKNIEEGTNIPHEEEMGEERSSFRDQYSYDEPRYHHGNIAYVPFRIHRNVFRASNEAQFLDYAYSPHNVLVAVRYS